MASATLRVLLLATSHGVLGKLGYPTGAWLSEITHPYDVMVTSGEVEVDFASPRGGAVPIDPYSDPHNPQGNSTGDTISAAFLANAHSASALRSSQAAAAVDPARYDAVFVAGGNGAVFDLPSDPAVTRLLQAFVDSNKVVAAVCHGSAALVPLTKAGTRGRVPLVAGEDVTGFTNEEEALAEGMIGATGYLPFYLQTELERAGARFRHTGAFKPYAVVGAHGGLITGQQNFSGAEAATALLRELRARRAAALAFVPTAAELRQHIQGVWQSRSLERVSKPDGRVLWRRRVFDIQADRYRLLADVFADAEASQRLFSLEFEGPYAIREPATATADGAGDASGPPSLPAGTHLSEWTHRRWWIAPQSAQFAQHVLAADPRTADAATWEIGVPVDVSEYGAIDIPSVAAGPTEYDVVAVHVAGAAAGSASGDRDTLVFGERGPFPPARIGLRPQRLAAETFVRSDKTYATWRASMLRTSERLARRIAVLGAGHVGGTLGALLAQSGHTVVFGARNPDKEEVVRAAAAAGPNAAVATVADAVRDADVVLNALPWAAVESTLGALDLRGKVVIDATNPIGPGFSLVLGHSTSGGERVAEVARGAHVVKCFNTIGYNHFTVPVTTDGKRKSLFLCGDDHASVAWTAAVVRQLGFHAVECGPLAQARLTEPLALLWISYAAKLGKGRDHAIALFAPAPALPAQF